MSRAGGYAADRKIIHVDMDAFYASVEVLDDPSLKGKPVIVGSRPNERGVVSTCSYEARRYGIHSAMNIKEAYRLCPNGVYIHPRMERYREVSKELHRIWEEHASAMESVALDEAYIDVTDTAENLSQARGFAKTIKRRTFRELGLTCSVGLAYNMSAAKTASEERKPDGYFEILSKRDFVDLVIDRDIGVLFSVGRSTAEKLHSVGIHTVRDILERQSDVRSLLGNQGSAIILLAQGIDDREVTPYQPQDAKSVGREMTFQEDVRDKGLIADVLLLLSTNVADRVRRVDLHGGGVQLKITYHDMQSITRSKAIPSCDDALTIHREAVKMLESVEDRPVRLVGVSVFNLSAGAKQTTLDEGFGRANQVNALRDALHDVEERYGVDLGTNMLYVYRHESLYAVAEQMRVAAKEMRERSPLGDPLDHCPHVPAEPVHYPPPGMHGYRIEKGRRGSILGSFVTSG